MCNSTNGGRSDTPLRAATDNRLSRDSGGECYPKPSDEGVVCLPAADKAWRDPNDGLAGGPARWPERSSQAGPRAHLKGLCSRKHTVVRGLYGAQNGFAGTMGTISLSLARPAGPDPRNHLWFVTPDGARQRICDGHQWTEHPEDDAGFRINPTCNACGSMFTLDRHGGREAFVLDLESLRHLDTEKGGTPYNGYTPRIRGTPPLKGDGSMTTIPMVTFARFCAARKFTSQCKIAKDFTLSEENPGFISHRDFYGPLRRSMQTLHWRTGHLDTFEEMLPYLPQNPKLAHRKQHIQVAGRAYVDFCRAHPFIPGKAGRGEVSVGRANIAVNPELAMRTPEQDMFIVRLWFNAPPISRQVRETFSYLMLRAQSQGAWPTSYNIGVLDIRRRQLLPPIRPTFEKEQEFEVKANLFLDLL